MPFSVSEEFALKDTRDETEDEEAEEEEEEEEESPRLTRACVRFADLSSSFLLLDFLLFFDFFLSPDFPLSFACLFSSSLLLAFFSSFNFAFSCTFLATLAELIFSVQS